MTPNDTKPEKAEASAVLLEVEWQGEGSTCPSCKRGKFRHWFYGGGTGHSPECRLAAALQSSSSAEADLRALLSSAKATIALLMATEVDLRAERDALQDRVKVLEEALQTCRAAIVSEDNALAITCTIWVPKAISPAETLVDYIDAALNHGKGEDAHAAGQQIAKEAEG